MNTTPSERDGDDWQVMQPPAPRPSRGGRAVRAAGIFAGGAVAAGALVGGANAWAATGTSTPSATGGYGSAAPGYGARGAGQGGSSDAVVTGDEAAKVTAAVKAKDSAVTVTRVKKDADGSYDVWGTKAGAPVKFEVSTDLKTITAGGSGRGGHGGGPGGSADTPVTGAQADKVIAAVKAKDGSVTITSVRKDADGSYDALGTKTGAPVMFDVSADLATITQNAGGPGQHGGGAAPGGAAPGASSGSSSATPSST